MRILAAVDGSTQSEAALEALGSFKWAAGTEIVLFTVMKAAEIRLPFGRRAPDQASGADNKAFVSQSLQNMAAQLQQKLPGCRVSFEVAHGDAKTEILNGAKAHAADMILMGSRGHRGMELMLLGSVSQAVLMQGQCPVVIVKSEATEAPNSAPDLAHGFKNVLITVDNSPYSRAALMWAKTLEWPSDTRFKLITVVTPVTDAFALEENAARAGMIIREHDSLHAIARTELEEMATELVDIVGPGRVTTQVGEGDPREVILHTAGAWGADLIVMGSHGRTGLTKLFLGSVSHAVAVHGYCSVAIVKGIVPKGQGLRQQTTGMFKLPDMKEIELKLPPLPDTSNRPDSPHVPPGGMM